jgi:hypothetical protein
MWAPDLYGRKQFVSVNRKTTASQRWFFIYRMCANLSGYAAVSEPFAQVGNLAHMNRFMVSEKV